MVLRVRWRQGLPADELDALGVHRHREIHHLIGLKVGSWLGQAEDFIGVGCLRSHSFGPSHHDAIGPPLHHPQVFLLGLRMASVMKRVVENSGDGSNRFRGNTRNSA